MKGNVYTRQKCWSCGRVLVHSERRNGCFCEIHPKNQATGEFYVKFGRDINKRFPTYERSIRFLTGLRYEVDREKFDPRDYQSSNPLSFDNLATRYLEFKKNQNLASFYHIEQYINLAVEKWRDRNIKTIRKKDIREFLYGIPKISEKTRANYAATLRNFWYKFLYEEEEILTLADLPKIPDVPYELGFRKIVQIDIREKIVNRIRQRTYHINPKIWLGVDLLCAYNNLRPGDLLRLKEGDIDLEYGVLTFWRPTKSKKRKKPKVIRIRLLDYHKEEFLKLKAKYPATDIMPFFRHVELSGVAVNRPFAPGYFYKQWKKACMDLGIEDLDLYGGCRHSSITALAKEVGKDKARKFSGHDTNKAFDRYCQIADDDTFDMAQLMAKMRGKVVEFKKENTAPQTHHASRVRKIT
jgi:integrase